MNINYGGNLKSGDFIAVARQGYLELGWFEKEGKNTVHYFLLRNINWSIKEFNKDKNAKRFYSTVKTHAMMDPYKVIKINYPEEILVRSQDFEDFKTGTELLKQFKFIK
jgi:hypothetical protein